MAKNLQTGTSYTPLADNFDPRTTSLRELIEAHAGTLEESGKKSFISAFTGKKNQFASIFSGYLDRPAIDFVETFADDETNPLVKVYEKNDKVNPRRDMYSRVGAIEFHIKDQLTRAGVVNELFPEGMPMATDRVVRPDKPKAKARRYSYNPGLMGEWLAALDEYGRNNPKDLGIVKALEAQAHMGLRTGEIMNAPASALVRPEKRSASWGFFLDTDTPGVKMDENLNIAVGPRTYSIMQQALDVSQANDRNLFVNPDGSPIGKGEMTRVAKLIRVPGIMTDELTGQKLDTIQEAYDLRRMWVTLALNEFPGQGDRVGAAQGRAIGAVTKGGGAVKEYYSPSRGFYGKEATTVPNLMDQWLFEARTDELPEAFRPPEGQRISYATDFVLGSPVFEAADAPVVMGDLTARYVEPAPKTQVVRPEGPAVVSEPKPAVTTASPEPKTLDDLTPDLQETLNKGGFDLDAFLKGTAKSLGLAAAGTLAYEAYRDPIGTGAALATEVGLEKAAGLGLGTALSVALTPSGSAGPELTQPAPPPRMPEDPYPGQAEYPAFRQMKEMAMEPAIDESTEEMERIAMEDAGFVTRNRDQEAAPAQEVGFVNR